MIPTPAIRLAQLLERWTGIDLSRGGRSESLEKILQERSHAIGCPTPEAYIARLAGPFDPEVTRLVNAITVGYTWFFRDTEQLDIVSEALKDRATSGKRLQVWIAGSASGEEAYTLVMLAERLQKPAFVYGTDINSEVLELARAGRYGRWSVRDVPADLKHLFDPAPENTFSVCERLREHVRFERHNLMEVPPTAPDGRGWDIILCRNVLIYFRPEQSAQAIERLGGSLAEGGWLVLGGSEVVHTPPPGLYPAWPGGRLVLRKGAQKASPAPPPDNLLKRPVPLGAMAPLPTPGPRPAMAALSPMGSKVPSPAITWPLPLPSSGPRPAFPAGSPGQNGVTAVMVPGASAAQLAGLPNAVVPLLTEGNRCFQKGETDRALVAYGRAAELDPLCAEAHLVMGIALYTSGDALAAMQSLRRALFIAPELWPAAFYLALSFEDSGQVADAEREYRRVVETSHRTPELLSENEMWQDLDVWKRDMVTLSQRRAQRLASGERRTGQGGRG